MPSFMLGPVCARVSVLLCIAAFLLSSPAEARRLSIRELAAREVPLAVIAYRIAAANAATCPKREFLSGLILHDLTLYETKDRRAVTGAFSVTSGFGVLKVVPGSAAADADIRVDDEILAIGKFNVEEPRARLSPRSYRRMELFTATMHAASELGQTQLLIRRAGNLIRVPLRVDQGCGGKLLLTNSSNENAYSDGKHIVITTGISGLTQSADEMAFVIAHEMAHNVLGHSGPNRPHNMFGLSAMKKEELEADRLAVRWMQKAGYRPQGAVSLLQNAARRFWWNVSLTHPVFGTRINNVRDEMRLIEHQ